MNNRFEKSLTRIRRNIEPIDDWNEEDWEHYFTIVKALEFCSENYKEVKI